MNGPLTRHTGKILIGVMRHGETDDNVPPGQRYTRYSDGKVVTSEGFVLSGHNDVLLTANGVQQCIVGGGNMGRYMESEGLRADELSVLCSDLPRARLTHAYATLGMGGFGSLLPPPLYTPKLRERSAGELQGWYRDVAIKQFPEVKKAFSDHTFRYPGGESLRGCGTRAGKRLVDHALKYGRSILMFGHQLSNAGAVDYLERGEVTSHAWQWKDRMTNAGFIVVLFDLETRRGTVIFHS